MNQDAFATAPSSLEVLRQELDDAHRSWRSAWVEHGYNSAQERSAFERIEQVSLGVAMALVQRDKEETDRELTQLLDGLYRSVDASLSHVEHDLEQMRQSTDTVKQRLSELERKKA